MDGLAQSVSEILPHCLFALGLHVFGTPVICCITYATRMISTDETGREKLLFGRIRRRADIPQRIGAVTGDIGVSRSAADTIERYSDTTDEFV